MSTRLSFTLSLWLLGFALMTRAATGPVVLVAGWESGNVVQFDLATGRWSEIAQLPKGTHPRGIAVGDTGEIFLGLQDGKKNIARLEPGKAIGKTKDITGAIGRFGPGVIVYAGGKLWAAGDTDRVIYRIDPETGQVASPPEFRNCCNLVGLSVAGETLYAAEYFQRSILRFDLRSGLTNADRFISNSMHLNRPVGMTIGHNGNLYIGNGLEPTVVEFDINSGEFVRTLVDLGAGGKDGIYGLVFAPEVQRYYIASGSDVYEVASDGRLLASYNSPALKRAYGIALLPARLRIATAQPDGGSNAFGVALPSRPVTTLKMTAASLRIDGTPGERYQVQATTDFKDWQPIAVLDNVTGMVEFVDRDANLFQRRFYRLEILPGAK